jgi:predicted RNase H-like HicB family nuclease
MMGASVDPTITLVENDGGGWTAIDEATGVVSQGKTRESALENLDEAVAGYEGAGDPPSEDELREAGIDPDRNESGSLSDSDIFRG